MTCSNTHAEVLERMKKEVQGYNDAELKHALEVYDTVIITYKEQLDQAKNSLEQCKMERKAIIEEIEKRKKR